jgi:hypothetical protein
MNCLVLISDLKSLSERARAREVDQVRPHVLMSTVHLNPDSVLMSTVHINPDTCPAIQFPMVIVGFIITGL